ncbi:MAG: MmgE/PrpD family protein [Pseudomonadota bacterium]
MENTARDRLAARTAILNHVAQTTSEDIPEAAWQAARVFLLDTVGVGLAGSAADGADALVAAATTWGSGDVPVLGRTLLVAKPTAALLNGFFIHNLEWDAVHEPAVVHAMSVITAACLAEAAAAPSISGRDFTAAVILGVDIASGLGVAAQSGLRFFRPANAGTIGAALALARLRGLERAVFDDVMGLAYSQLSGTMQAHVEGSITLPLQVAVGARSAITAVDMAQAGLTAPHDVLDGPFGYFKLIEDGGSAHAVAEHLGKRWAIAELSHKPYPSGRASHAVLEFVLGQRAAHGFELEEVVCIEAQVPPLIHRLVARPYRAQMTSAYARLCLPYLCALAVRDGQITPTAASRENLDDEALAVFADKVQITKSDISDPNAMSPQACTIVLANGQRLSDALPHIYGAPDFSLTQAAYLGKFDLATQFAHAPIAKEAAEQLKLDLQGIDRLASVANIFSAWNS